jgi:hypothetical protein
MYKFPAASLSSDQHPTLESYAATHHSTNVACPAPSIARKELLIRFRIVVVADGHVGASQLDLAIDNAPLNTRQKLATPPELPRLDSIAVLGFSRIDTFKARRT